MLRDKALKYTNSKEAIVMEVPREGDVYFVPEAKMVAKSSQQKGQLIVGRLPKRVGAAVQDEEHI